jgi:hypothetical protein
MHISFSFSLFVFSMFSSTLPISAGLNAYPSDSLFAFNVYRRAMLAFAPISSAFLHQSQPKGIFLFRAAG